MLEHQCRRGTLSRRVGVSVPDLQGHSAAPCGVTAHSGCRVHAWNSSSVTVKCDGFPEKNPYGISIPQSKMETSVVYLPDVSRQLATDVLSLSSGLSSASSL